MKSAIIFSRISSSTQRIDRQISDLSTYADNNGYQVIEIIKEVVSGRVKNDARIGIQRIIDLVEERRVESVLVSEISRISRKISQVTEFISYLTDNKVELVITNLNLSTLLPDKTPNPISNILVSTLSSFAEMEVESIRNRVKSGLKKAKERGIKIGRPQHSFKSEEQLLKDHKDVIKFLERGDLSMREIRRLTGRGLATIQKLKNIIHSQELAAS